VTWPKLCCRENAKRRASPTFSREEPVRRLRVPDRGNTSPRWNWRAPGNRHLWVALRDNRKPRYRSGPGAYCRLRDPLTLPRIQRKMQPSKGRQSRSLFETSFLSYSAGCVKQQTTPVWVATEPGCNIKEVSPYTLYRNFLLTYTTYWGKIANAPQLERGADGGLNGGYRDSKSETG
jgi:hypothetical protein